MQDGQKNQWLMDDSAISCEGREYVLLRGDIYTPMSPPSSRYIRSLKRRFHYVDFATKSATKVSGLCRNHLDMSIMGGA